MENTKQTGVFQIGAELEWEDVGPGIKRVIYGYNNQLMLLKMEFEAGAVGTLHNHPHVQASYIESGVFELTIGDEKKNIKTARRLFCTAKYYSWFSMYRAGGIG